MPSFSTQCLLGQCLSNFSIRQNPLKACQDADFRTLLRNSDSFGGEGGSRMNISYRWYWYCSSVFLLQVCSADQLPHHHLKVCWKCRILGTATDPRNAFLKQNHKVKLHTHVAKSVITRKSHGFLWKFSKLVVILLAPPIKRLSPFPHFLIWAGHMIGLNPQNVLELAQWKLQTKISRSLATSLDFLRTSSTGIMKRSWS